MLAALLAGCAAPGDGGVPAPEPRPGMAEALRRLPAQADAFRRGGTTEPRGFGEAAMVDYATPSRTAAAQVMLYDRGLPAATPAQVPAELEAAVREATAQPAERTGRSLTEVGRSSLAVPGGTPLSCAVLDGRFGRNPVERHVCVGAVGGRFLRVQVTLPDRPVPVADSAAFARAIAVALRTG
ncbi:hypothetical protein LPC08_08665 [Roseomonas sp. OT10]|uniref:hypothetical protein n=1 Tax=Roseomonas cutis TaxID=2897332 RepID=UPI001E50B67C|nr:hypothetical protein [Roseomonas sp. OT10]UFN50669.1 hypothetical protein LPC08_08665 [Roseomonas sp. OT10]